MIVRLAIRLVVLAAIIYVVARIVPGIHVHGSAVWLLWVALLLPAIRKGRHARSAAAHDPA